MKKLLLLLFLAVLSPAFAQDVSLTSDVSVDVLGENANDARNKALIEAERDGFEQLLEKLSPEFKESILQGMDEKKISLLVKATEVIEERITGNRYRANLRISYSVTEINKLIDAKTSAHSNEFAGSRATLVIPLLALDDKTLLFEPENKWAQAWLEAGVSTADGRVVVPYGDGMDVAALTLQNAQNGNYTQLRPMLRRYGAAEAVVLTAKVTPDGRSLALTRRDITASGTDVSNTSFRADKDEPSRVFLVRAAQEIAAALRARQGMQTTKHVSPNANKQLVVGGVTSAKDWNKMRSKIMSLPIIEKIEPIAMSATQVDFLVYFQGKPESLQEALTSIGYPTKPSATYWIISK